MDKTLSLPWIGVGVYVAWRATKANMTATDKRRAKDMMDAACMVHRDTSDGEVKRGPDCLQAVERYNLFHARWAAATRNGTSSWGL